jgi:hypothetical protein
LITLGLLAFSTWIITPIGNLFLRFNTYGQLLLSRRERLSSNFVGASFLVFLLSIALYFVIKIELYLIVAFFGLTMMLPLGVMLSTSKSTGYLVGATILLAFIGFFAITTALLTGNNYTLFSIVYTFGFIAFQWIATFLISRD